MSDFFPLRYFLSTYVIFVRLYRFVLLLGCVFVLLVLFVPAKSFCENKKKKEFKTALITSFTLLLNLSYYKHELF